MKQRLPTSAGRAGATRLFHGLRPTLAAVAAAVAIALSPSSPAAQPKRAAPEAEEAAKLASEAEKHEDSGNEALAVPLRERVVELKERAYGKESAEVAEALLALSQALADADPARAEALMQRALTIFEKRKGRQSLEASDALMSLGAFYFDVKRDPAAAQPMVERAIAAREKGMGREHKTVARNVTLLGEIQEARGDRAGAEASYLRAIRALEKTAPTSGELGEALQRLGRLYYNQKARRAEAEPILTRALNVVEKTQGADHVTLAATLEPLAQIYMDRDEPARAEPLLRRSLAIQERAHGPNDPLVALTCEKLGDVYVELNDDARAEPLYTRALTILDATAGLPAHVAARSLRGLGSIFERRGDLTRAEAHYRRLLNVWEKALGRESVLVTIPLLRLGAIAALRGDYVLAEQLHLRAYAIEKKELGPDDPALARTLLKLARIYKARGDFPSTGMYVLKVFEICSKLPAGHPAIDDLAGEITGIMVAIGEFDRAEGIIKDQLARKEKALGPEHPDVANIRVELAMLYARRGDEARGDLKTAEALLERAIAVKAAQKRPFTRGLARLQNELAMIYRARGELERAEARHNEAIATYEKDPAANSTQLGHLLSNLALAQAARSDVRGAVRSLDRATALHDALAASMLFVGSERQKRDYVSRELRTNTYTVISLHADQAPGDRDASRLALRNVLRRKGVVIDAMADLLRVLRSRADEKGRALLDELASVQTGLAALIGNPGAPDRAAQIVKLERRRQELEIDVSALAEDVPRGGRLITVEEVQAAVPEGAALLEIVLYRSLDFKTKSVGIPFGKLRYAAYILSRRGEPAFVSLGDAAPIDAAVERFRAALADATPDTRPAGRALDALVMQPIRKALGEARWVLVSPDGALNLVPFAALIDESDKYLVERYLFTYLTSGRDLLRFKSAQEPEGPALVVGDPSFNDSGAADPGAKGAPPPPKRGQLERAVGTEQQARAIQSIFPKARLLLGAGATEGALKAAKRPRFVHLATHGVFLPGPPVHEAGSTSADPWAGADAQVSHIQGQNPLLRSFVALSGFNPRKSGDEDGMLTALEVAGLDLRGTKLVTLATCESGVGAASVGDGVHGLRRALSIAGAEAQVMSLWQVFPAETLELMVAYYKKLAAGEGRSEAMRAVQLEMLASEKPGYAHPNRWASFVVSGDYRPLDGRPALPKVPAVSPGSRGCGCALAGADLPAYSYAAWPAFFTGALAAAGLRRARRRPPSRPRA